MRGNNLFYTLLIIVVMILALQEYDNVNLDITTEYIQLLPGLLVTVASLYGVKNSCGPMLTGAFFMFGCGLALLTAQLNTVNILIPTILTADFPLKHLQVLIVVLSTIIGAAANN